MRYCWTVLFCALAIGVSAGTPSLAAPTDEDESETIIVPSDPLDEIDPGMDEPEPGEEAEPVEDVGPPPTVEYDPAKLPPPVRRIREQILEAAKTGDIEKLRPIFEANGEPPVVSLTEIDDPVEHLKTLSGDPEGREILAILIEVLDAGYVHADPGTPEEMFIWPYFAKYPLDALTPPQMVELFKLLTAGDYEDMKIYGTYIFYRAGIEPNGVWKFFVAGD